MKQALAIVVVLVFAVAIIAVAVVVFSGLTGFSLGAGSSADGGVFKTTDRGMTWVQKVATKGQGSLGGVDVSILATTVQQPDAVFLGTTGRGLWRSTSSAEVWSPVVFGRTLTNRSNVTALAVDPTNASIFYVGTWSENLGVVLRTSDNGSSFETLYTTTRSAAITGIIVDPTAPARMFVATAQGGVLVTENRGATWRALQWFGGPIQRIAMTADSALWAIPKTGGLWRSRTRGETWEDLSTKLATLAGAQAIAAFVQDPAQPRMIYLGTNRGVVRSADGGDTWADVKLIVPPQALPVTALAIPPGESNTIYAAGGSFVFKSTDSAVTWQSVKLPTGRRAVQLILQPGNAATLYLGLGRARSSLFGL